MLQQQYFSYILTVMWYMTWEGEISSLHFYWLKGIFNLPHHIGMMWEELTFDDAVNYTQWGNVLQHS